MRSAPRSILFTLAAACWLAAGPGGLTVREVLVCRHHAAHHTAGHHPASPADGPCFCDQMAGALHLAVSTAVPPPLAPPLSILPPVAAPSPLSRVPRDRKSTRLNSSHVKISYAVFCLKKKKKKKKSTNTSKKKDRKTQ